MPTIPSPVLVKRLFTFRSMPQEGKAICRFPVLTKFDLGIGHHPSKGEQNLLVELSAWFHKYYYVCSSRYL